MTSDYEFDRLDLCAELQAILKPLLEKPYSRVSDWYRAQCVFCLTEETTEYVVGVPLSGTDTTIHKPECPVLRKDELLR